MNTTVFFEDESSTAFGISDRGRVRETNQDQFLIAQLTKSMLVSATSLQFEQRLHGKTEAEVLLVADGMGGHAAGERASRLAIGHLVRRMLSSVHWLFQGEEDDETKEKVFIEDLRGLFRDAHERILRESAKNAEQRGMGTTLTMAHLAWPRMYVAHAGDSRCYLIRNGVAKQLTTDHTLARQMVESGGLKPEEEADSKWSNVLWNVLGGNADGEAIAEVRRTDLRSGDVIVLCSDGLHRYVAAEQLADVVSNSDSPEIACRRLTAIANQSGGEDNITVIVSEPDSNDISASTWAEGFETIIPERGKPEDGD